MRRRRAPARLEPRPGFVLSFQGADIGVVERVETSSVHGAPILRARGGVSGCLEYVIPLHAIVSVQAKERRADIQEGVVFEAEHVGEDGRVTLVGRVEASLPGGAGET